MRGGVAAAGRRGDHSAGAARRVRHRERVAARQHRADAAFVRVRAPSHLLAVAVRAGAGGARPQVRRGLRVGRLDVHQVGRRGARRRRHQFRRVRPGRRVRHQHRPRAQRAVLHSGHRLLPLGRRLPARPRLGGQRTAASDAGVSRGSGVRVQKRGQRPTPVRPLPGHQQTPQNADAHAETSHGPSGRRARRRRRAGRTGQVAGQVRAAARTAVAAVRASGRRVDADGRAAETSRAPSFRPTQTPRGHPAGHLRPRQRGRPQTVAGSAQAAIHVDVRRAGHGRTSPQQQPRGAGRQQSLKTLLPQRQSQLVPPHGSLPTTQVSTQFF